MDGLGRGDGVEADKALYWLFAEDVLAVELGHLGVFGVLLQLLVAGADFFFAGVLRDSELIERVVGFRVDVVHVELELVAHVRHAHLLATGEDFVTAMLLIPLGEGGGHVHLLDDVAPAYAGVVGAEGDFAFLRGVGNDALLGAAEVVIEEVLEPHAGDEEEVPTVLAALLDVFHGAVALDAAVVLAGGVEGLVHLLEHVGDLEVRGRLERIVVAQQSKTEADDRKPFAAGGVVDLGEILGDLVHVEEGRDGCGFLGFLVDHHGHADAAVGMAAAGELAPLGAGSVNHVGPVREGAHEGDREPVALGFADAHLVLDVVRHVRERVTLGETALVGDVLVAACEADGLEREEADLLGVVEGELDDAAHLLIVDAIDDGRHGHDFYAGFMEIVDRLELDVEHVADLAVRVGSVADAVELEVDVTEAGFASGTAEFLGLGELDTVGGGLDGVVADLAGVGYGVKEVGRERGLATGELDGHLTTRLDGDGVVEHGLDFVPRELVDEADLVGVHEAGVAHHVAAVGEVDRQDRTAAVSDRRGAVVVELGVVVGADVAAGKGLFKVLEEGRVDGHDVFEVAVLGAILDHEDLAVALDDLSLDFANLLIQKDFMRKLAVEDLLADFGDAFGTEGVRGAGPAEGRLFLLVGLEEWLVAPLGRERGVGADAVEALEDGPGCLGRVYNAQFGVFNRFSHDVRFSFEINGLRGGRDVLGLS